MVSLSNKEIPMKLIHPTHTSDKDRGRLACPTCFRLAPIGHGKIKRCECGQRVYYQSVDENKIVKCKDGNLYDILAIQFEQDTKTMMVVYRQHGMNGNLLNIRSLNGFAETIELEGKQHIDN